MSDETPAAERRRHFFGPIVLLGLASSALLAVAAAKPAITVPSSFWKATGMGGFQGRLSELAGEGAGQLPLASALSLVLLAAWGVVLVTRGAFRRTVAVIALLAAAGAVLVLVVGWEPAAMSLEQDIIELLGKPDDASFYVPTERTGWWWTAVAAGAVATFASLVACLKVKHWPEMGQKYDAPTRPEAATPTAEGDLWRRIDEGHDPTA